MYTVHVSGSSHTLKIDNTNEHNTDNTIVLADLSTDLYIYIRTDILTYDTNKYKCVYAIYDINTYTDAILHIFWSIHSQN